MKEADLMRQIQVEVSKLGARLFRNNVALAWVGELFRVTKATTVMLFPGDVLLRKARPLHAGLVKGSSDLIGLKSITITPEMVGAKIAVFSAIEVKTEHKKAEEDQKDFLAFVLQAGGFAGIARSTQDAVDIFGKP